ncbi:MAG: hypothetical protein Q9188_007554 [Gyalolechia gomerana]
MTSRVVGPPHIGKLMKSLEQNNFVRHFLLGNNIIGPTGAKEVASYMSRQPDQMETWYLAGNCIDSSSLKLLVDGWVTSSTLSNIWLKRNPLGPSSVSALFKLITNASGLRTLDLDQTELSDAGVGELFNLLAVNDLSSVRLQHIYLNANGISTAACQALAKYLATENCSLQSLYLSNNPVGDKGATALAEGLRHNTSILRLSVRSSGLKSPGAITIMEVLASHPKLMTLDLGYNFATEDLDSRYNCFDDSIKDAACKLIQTSQTLQYLDLGITFMTTQARTEIADAVCDSSSLLTFKADTVFEKLPRPLKRVIRARLTENLKKVYGDEMTYEEFEQGEQRWLISPKDVRFIDSAYRNRDAELARRGLIRLEKKWADEGELERVMGSGV